jgi:Na+/H+-translocating membrane pyrophosphatase
MNVSPHSSELLITFLRCVANHLQAYMASQPKRLQPTCLPPLEPQISDLCILIGMFGIFFDVVNVNQHIMNALYDIVISVVWFAVHYICTCNKRILRLARRGYSRQRMHFEDLCTPVECFFYIVWNPLTYIHGWMNRERCCVLAMLHRPKRA